MLRPIRHLPQTPCRPLPPYSLRSLLLGTALALAAPAFAHADPAPAPAPVVTDKQPIDFEADRVVYSKDDQIVTASGNVFLRQGEQTVRADTVSWNRQSGAIVAQGHVRFVDQDGNQSFTDRVTLTDTFSVGAMENILVVLRDGGRLAAKNGSRDDEGRVHLTHAAYTSCDVVDEKGRPCKPSWRITAKRVVVSPQTKDLRLYGAHLVLFGIASIPLPKLEIPTDGRPISGLLIPDATTSSTNGVGYNQTFYVHLAPNRDLSLTGFAFTKAAPMLSAQFRALTDAGAYQITGYVTRSDAIGQSSTTGIGQQQFRGYIDTNGQFQLSPAWSASFSGRLASDRTFLSRYYLSSDDILRSTASIERTGDTSHLSIAGWAFETLRPGESQGQVPIALPEIDYRRRLQDPLLGGMVSLEANSLAISRTGGQDTQRAFASAQWSLSRITGMGQVITLTGLLRGDVYHASSAGLLGDIPLSIGSGFATNPALPGYVINAATPGWHSRGEVLGAVDVTWPLVGAAFGGTQVFTPHVQLVGTPPVPNTAFPNEDAGAISFEDTNLFALNRFPGADRIEDGVRVTYGADWQFERPRWRILADIGQSYRLTANSAQFPDGTGLYDRLSDVVGRAEISYRDLFKVTDRFRIDKNSFAFRQNEIDATIGSEQTYAEVGYARISQGLAATLGDLQDSNELRGAGRVSFARYWSVFGSGVFDLSQSNLAGIGTESPFQPLRTRVGVSYRSDCFEVDLTWRKDYVSIGDAAKGSSFGIHFALRNIGLK